jgi:hypothetical protein
VVGDLLEREQVLAAADRCLESACAGAGGVLFVVGKGGLGKTSVLDWLRARVPDGVDVGAGRGEPMEQRLAFGLASQALGEVCGEPFVREGPAIEPSAPYYRVLRALEARAVSMAICFSPVGAT